MKNLFVYPLILIISVLLFADHQQHGQKHKNNKGGHSKDRGKQNKSHGKNKSHNKKHHHKKHHHKKHHHKKHFFHHKKFRLHNIPWWYYYQSFDKDKMKGRVNYWSENLPHLLHYLGCDIKYIKEKKVYYNYVINHKNYAVIKITLSTIPDADDITISFFLDPHNNNVAHLIATERKKGNLLGFAYFKISPLTIQRVAKKLHYIFNINRKIKW